MQERVHGPLCLRATGDERDPSASMVTDEDATREFGSRASWRMAQTQVRQTEVANSRRGRLAVVSLVVRSVSGRGGGDDGKRGTLSGASHAVTRE